MSIIKFEITADQISDHYNEEGEWYSVKDAIYELFDIADELKDGLKTTCHAQCEITQYDDSIQIEIQTPHGIDADKTHDEFITELLNKHYDEAMTNHIDWVEIDYKSKIE